jgi:chromosome segregation ATPase
MSASRPTNTDIHRTLGRLEAQLEGLNSLMASHITTSAEGAKELAALRTDVTEVKRDVAGIKKDIEPIREQTEWLKTKRAQGVGFVAAFSLGVAFIASALGAVGSRAWALLIGDA